MARATWDNDAAMAAASGTDFGGRVRLLRCGRRLTQRWLADEARISVTFLSDIENGKTAPSADTLERLADVLGVTMDDLWRGTGRCDPAELVTAKEGT